MAEEAVMGDRAAILSAIRAANGGAGSEGAAPAAWEGLERKYRRTSELGREALLDLFEQRLKDYDAHVVRVGREGVAGIVGELMLARGKRLMVVPAGMRRGMLPKGFEFVVDGVVPGEEDVGLSAALRFGQDDTSLLPGDAGPMGDKLAAAMTAAQLNAMDGVVTCSTLGIAQTGTIVLQSVPGQGRRAITLVPDYHVCVVDGADVVATVPEAMDRLAATKSLPTTFISGPSATADIEMTRIKGVHGPRFLDVVLIV